MKKLNCICGFELIFNCKISGGDEIWVCSACEAEYIYNSITNCLYSGGKFIC
jgi:hypothetical protein